jgi:hypothetical protein
MEDLQARIDSKKTKKLEAVQRHHDDISKFDDFCD